MTTRMKNYDNEYEDYLKFIEQNIPNSLFIKSPRNKDLFISVNTSFILSDILTEFEFVTPHNNYYNLLIEYKNYFARILSAISLNDKFLIDNLLRLLTEKLYRILTAIAYPNRGERRIRRDSRSNMSNDLLHKINPKVRQNIDMLYARLSGSIHHTISKPDDLYNIRKLFATPLNITEDTLIDTNRLTDLFLEEVFVKECLKSIELCGTNFSVRIENNLQSDVIQRIRSKLNI